MPYVEQEWKSALEQAESHDFKAFKLNQKAKIVAKYKSTKGISSNVVGYIEGSDPKLKEEAVLFSAHYDAYGMENGKIYFVEGKTTKNQEILLEVINYSGKVVLKDILKK